MDKKKNSIKDNELKDVANVTEDRRRAVRNILAGSGIVAGAASNPTWVKPVIDAVVLPAHAQSSTTLPVTLIGNALVSAVTPITKGQPIQQKTSILDLFIEPAYAGVMMEPNLEGACMTMNITDPTTFDLMIEFANDPTIMIDGTIDAMGAVSGSGSGVTVAGTADIAARTASGPIMNGSGTFNYNLSDTIVACMPVEPTTTTTTTTPTTTTLCPTGYSYGYGELIYAYPPSQGFGYGCFFTTTTTPPE